MELRWISLLGLVTMLAAAGVVMKGRSSDFLEVDEGEVAFLLSKHEQDRRLAKKVLLLTGFDEDEVEDILDNSDFEFVDGVLNLSSKEEADDDGV